MPRPALLPAIVLALATSGAAAANHYTGSMEPCLDPHGDGARYRAGLTSTGWVDVSDAGREVAINMVADAFLPVTAPMLGLPWSDLIATRATARAFWTDLSQGRTLMEREGRVLLLAGFLDTTGEMRVECWTAGPTTTATGDFFALAGEITTSEGVEIAALGAQVDEHGHPRTEILVLRLTPPVAPDPPLAATDGLRTTIIFSPGEVQP